MTHDLDVFEALEAVARMLEKSGYGEAAAHLIHDALTGAT